MEYLIEGGVISFEKHDSKLVIRFYNSYNKFFILLLLLMISILIYLFINKHYLWLIFVILIFGTYAQNKPVQMKQAKIFDQVEIWSDYTIQSKNESDKNSEKVRIQKIILLYGTKDQITSFIHQDQEFEFNEVENINKDNRRIQENKFYTIGGRTWDEGIVPLLKKFETMDENTNGRSYWFMHKRLVSEFFNKVHKWDENLKYQFPHRRAVS